MFTGDRLNAYVARLGAHVADAGAAALQPSRLLATAVSVQANVLAYEDGFAAAALGAFGCLILVALMRRAPPSPFRGEGQGRRERHAASINPRGGQAPPWFRPAHRALLGRGERDQAAFDRTSAASTQSSNSLPVSPQAG